MSRYPCKSEHYVEIIEVILFEKCGFEQNVQWMSNFFCPISNSFGSSGFNAALKVKGEIYDLFRT